MNTKDRMGSAGVSLHLGRLTHLFAALAISSLLLSFGAIPALAAGPSGHVQPAATTSDAAVAEKPAGAVALNEDDDEDDDDDDEDTEGSGGGGGGGGGLPATDTVSPSGQVPAATTSDAAVAEKPAGAVALNEDDDEDDDDDDEDTEGSGGGGGGGGGLPATDTVSAAGTETGGVSPLSLGALAIAGLVAGAMSWNRKRDSEESAS